jgi:hypothetical protein
MWQSIWWWSARCTMTHQAILDNHVVELKQQSLQAYAAAARDFPPTFNDEYTPGSLSSMTWAHTLHHCMVLCGVRVLVEAAQADFSYWNYRRMKVTVYTLTRSRGLLCAGFTCVMFVFVVMIGWLR